MYSKEKYYERKEKGLCVQCGKPNDNGKVTCDECTLNRRRAYIKRCNKRIAEGGCVLCGKPLWGATQYCEEHYKNKREKQKMRYVERKQEGKCCCCGKPIEEGNKTVYCDNCREKKKESRRAYIENGVCPICKKNQVFYDRPYCVDCWEKNLKKSKEYRLIHSEILNKKSNERKHRQIIERKEQGLCTKCGKRKADYGKATCTLCRTKATEYKRQLCGYGARMTYPDGFCKICGEPAYKNYKVCEKHYNNMVYLAHLPQTQEARKKNLKNCSYR